MPEINWEWKIGPGFLVSVVQLVAIVVAVVGGFIKMELDVEASHQTTTQLQTVVKTMQESQAKAGDRLTRVETKVDLMLPILQKIQGQTAPARTGQ